MVNVIRLLRSPLRLLEVAAYIAFSIPCRPILSVANTTRADETTLLIERYGDDAADTGLWSASSDVDGPGLPTAAIRTNTHAYYLGIMRLGS